MQFHLRVGKSTAKVTTRPNWIGKEKLITFDTQAETSLWSSRRVTCYTFSRFSKIVLVAIQDSADTYGSVAISALKRLGAREPIIIEFRSSFALAGFAGLTLPSWVSQVQNKRYKGPSILRVTIEGGNKISTSLVTCREATSSLFIASFNQYFVTCECERLRY